MTDRKITVPSGSRVRVEIPRKAPSSAVSSDEESRSVLFSDEDGDSYVFRKKGSIEFYDLGTRKVGDGDEYEHVTYESFIAAQFSGDHTPLATTPNARLLAGDIDSSIRIPQLAEWLHFDVVLKQGSETHRELIGNPNTRPYVINLPSGDEPHPEIVTHSNYRGGKLALKHPGEWQMIIESAWFYNIFDTSDTLNFKITRTPDSSDDRVEDFTITSKDKVKVFLVPRMIRTQEVIDDSGSEDILRYSMARLPVLPNFEPVSVNIWHDPGPPDLLTPRKHATPEYWAAVTSYHSTQNFPADWPGVSFFDDTIAMLMADVLGVPCIAAVIEKNGEKFYVWATSIRFDILWTSSGLFNPT